MRNAPLHVDRHFSGGGPVTVEIGDSSCYSVLHVGFGSRENIDIFISEKFLKFSSMPHNTVPIPLAEYQFMRVNTHNWLLHWGWNWLRLVPAHMTERKSHLHLHPVVVHLPNPECSGFGGFELVVAVFCTFGFCWADGRRGGVFSFSPFLLSPLRMLAKVTSSVIYLDGSGCFWIS